MALENPTFISDLDSSNPAGTDSRAQGDNHIRNLKSAIQTTFPNIEGAVTATQADINKLDGLHTTTEQLDYVGGYCKVSGSKTDDTQAECETETNGTPLGTWYPAVTSQIQTQFSEVDTKFDTKLNIVDPEFAGTVEVGYCATSDGTLLPTHTTTTDCTEADDTNVWSTNTVVQTGVSHDFAAAQYSASIDHTTTTDDEAVSVDLSLSNVFVLNLANTGATLAVTNQQAGGCYTAIIKNGENLVDDDDDVATPDVDVGFDVDFTAAFNFSGGEPTLTGGAGKVDLVSCVSDGTNLYCSINYDLTSS